LSTHIEVLPAGSRPRGAGDAVSWPVTGSSGADVQTTIDWDLEKFAAASAAARDLFRIAASVFLADTYARKPAVGLHRDLHVTIHVEDDSRWGGPTLVAFADLLHWMTGDTWDIEVCPSDRQPRVVQAESLPARRVQLLSGGLDSLCGAIVGLRDGVPIEFLGHRDSANAVRKAQDLIGTALDGDAPYRREEFFLRDSFQRRNHGPRSRSLMFMLLGVLVADTASAPDLWVPENGFTSINPPLDPGRGGTLTTRSTHPYTFYLVNRLVSSAGVAVTISNPFDQFTKGEVVAQAGAALVGEKWARATEGSYSCGRGNTQYFKGNPNQNCGLCVACIVRRASFIAGGVGDPTTYVCNELSGADLARLVEARLPDIISVDDARQYGLDEAAVLTSGAWPPGANLDEVMNLVGRGLSELRAVTLPST
jgi:hypothetical protein